MIHLHTQKHWAIVGIWELGRFFNALSVIFPHGTIIYLGSHSPNHSLAKALSRYRATRYNTSIDSNPWEMHLLFDASTLTAIMDLLWEEPDLLKFDHLHCYIEEEMLMWFHDAFTGGDTIVNAKISADLIKEFVRLNGPQYKLCPPLL